MKTRNYLKISLILLVILMVLLIGYIGIYVPIQNRIENILPDYQWGRDIKGSRVLSFKVDTSTEEVVKDQDGNVIESATDEEIEQNGYTKVEEPINKEEALTVENYDKVKDIMEKRLQASGFSDYVIRLNRDNGNMAIELKEDQTTDDVINLLYSQGKFEMTDSDTGEVLLSNKDIKNSSVLYANSGTGSVSVYLSIEFNKEAKAKLEEISNTYVSTTDEEGNETEKTVAMTVDGQTLIESSFDEPITTGEIQLSLGSGTSDSDQLQTYIEQASMIATLLNTGDLPITYEVDSNKYIQAENKDKQAMIAGIVILAIAIIGIIYWIIRYHKNGLFAAISFIGLPALILLVIRLTNVEITVAGIVAMVLTAVLNYFLLTMILKQLKHVKKIRISMEEKIIRRSAFLVVPLLVVAVVFTFIGYAPISSFGMNLFWGIALLIGYNLLITKPLLEEINKPKKGEE